MRLIRSTGNRFVFRLGKSEKHLLLELLKLYPLVPASYQPLTRCSHLPDHAEDQRLLDEALAEQRAENRQRLDALLASPRRFKKQESGWNLSLSGAELEWLLQVLNDIRIGSWLSLGSPDKPLAEVKVQTAPHVLAIEMADYFQTRLLAALGA